ncbi:hypothetical protein [Streptococcus infantarius]|jgi:hypothetical protein|uniref:hypothetical protein n=1 Tax=Streptococcus infantarius TaxID=102684 RepID=UPI00205FA653|nr:MAG TPA_asm: hypothetical protein [Caudoviricetes sp.]
MGGRGSNSGSIVKLSKSVTKRFPSKAELRSRLTKSDLRELDEKVEKAIALNISKGHFKESEIGSYKETLREQLADRMAKKYITKEEKTIGRETTSKRIKRFEESQSPVKAWDWAAKKAGLTTKITDKEKERFVNEMSKEMWSGSSIYAQAMKAVKLHQKLFGNDD